MFLNTDLRHVFEHGPEHVFEHGPEMFLNTGDILAEMFCEHGPEMFLNTDLRCF